MKHTYVPILLVIAILVTATFACDGSSSGNTSHGQPREMRWTLGTGELTSQAMQRWVDAFPTCRVVKHAMMIGGPTEHLAIWYTCDADR